MPKTAPHTSNKKILQEVHHRINNSLQMISSLLDLEVACSPGISGQDVVQSNRKRIMSMALLHHELSHSKDFIHTDIRKYVFTLSRKMLAGRIARKEIDFTFEMGVCEFTADTLIPLGLILNELFEIILQSPSPSAKRLSILIKSEIYKNQYIIVLSDNSENPDSNSSSRKHHLSYKLISGLGNQINANITYKKNKNNITVIGIPLKLSI